MKKRFIMILWCSLNMLMVTAFAELKDPTYPPNLTGEEAGIATWQLTAIIVSPDRKIAIINGQPVQLGEKISGNELTNIDSNSVQLEGSDGRMTLFLLDNQLKISDFR